MEILLTVAYDGTNYCGWQRQDNALTVQECLEEALTKTYGKKITVTGASRTDTGVHALGQRAVFIPGEIGIPVDKIPYALNAKLPEDIAVTKAIDVTGQEFHPQYKAKNKTYRYRIYNGPFRNPVLRNHTWHVYYDLDIEKMRKGASYILGEHDFSCFCASGGSAKTTVRTVYSLDVNRSGNEIYFDINGSGFLYNMVRIIAGTLVYCGCGKIDPDDVGNIILSKDRKLAGITAPPQGLCLMEINY